jgi:hypothetical protein
MLKFANQIIDAYDDVTKETLTKIAQVNPDCNMLTPEERTALKDHQFAVSVITKTAGKLNKFPIDSKDSTWLSMEYFNSNYHKMPYEATKLAAWHIKKACIKFDLKPSLNVDSFAAMTKNASSNVYYERDNDVKASEVVVKPDLSKLAQVEAIGDNYTVAQHAMPSPSHVKLAMVYLEKNADKIPIDLRHKYAAAIQRRSHELGMGAQKGYVAKYASDHYSPMVDAHIKARASLLEGKPELKATVEKLGSAKGSCSPSQFAQMLHSFDKEAGLSGYYGAHLTDPFQATFASEPGREFMAKVASHTITGDVLQQVVNTKYAQIKDYFGSHVADELRKYPNEIFSSLPMDAKEIIVGLAEGTH